MHSLVGVISPSNLKDIITRNISDKNLMIRYNMKGTKKVIEGQKKTISMRQTVNCNQTFVSMIVEM